MTKDLFSDAVTQISSDAVERFVAMDERLERKRARKRAVMKWGSAAACLLLAVGIGVSGALGFWSRDALPTDIENIAWNTGDQGFTEGLVISPWKGWHIDYFLHEQLVYGDAEQYIAIRVMRREEAAFEFEGRTIGQMRTEKDEAYAKASILEVFLKEGHALQYGELLYTEGTPDGERWTKEHYDERLAFYGEVFLKEYIANSIFLKEKAESDLQECRRKAQTLEVAYNRAIDAYHKSYLVREAEIFSAEGACAIVKNSRLFLFVTRIQLETLEIEGKEQYSLSFAKRRSYEHIEGEIPTLKNNVTGFALDKITCEVTPNKLYSPESDEKLIETINGMIRTGQFDTDQLLFTVYGNESLSEELFADMNCEDLSVLSYVNAAHASVLFENIDLEALRDLSLQPSVTSITISWEVTEFAPA